MTTLTDFLLTRIADDEANARSIQNAEYFHGVSSDVEPEVLVFADPARVLAECEAKRRIALMLQHLTNENWPHTQHTYALSLACTELASVYADHPDYREEWRA